jgi:hypothetical protein
MSHLSVRFEPDTDGTGELFVQVEHKGFSGTGSAWFHVQELIEFAQQLENTFPFPPDARFQLNGGYWNSPEPTIKDLHVGLAVYTVGTLGEIGLQVHLESLVPMNVRAETKSTLSVELITNYEPLRSFACQLQAMLAGNIETARLQANDF